MRFAFVAAIFALGASALPQPQDVSIDSFGGGGGNPRCLSDKGADYIVNSYAKLLEFPQGADFNATAQKLLSNKFIVYSDSINSLSGRPLGQPSYPSKQAFIAGQAQTPALPGLTTLEVFHTCNKIAWRWIVTEFGTRTAEIKAFIQLDVDPAKLQIDQVFSEFNTIAFAANIPQQG